MMAKAAAQPVGTARILPRRNYALVLTMRVELACKRRAFDGGGNGTVKHISGNAIYQSEFSVLVTSTGVITGGILTSIQRVLQTNVLSLKGSITMKIYYKLKTGMKLALLILGLLLFTALNWRRQLSGPAGQRAPPRARQQGTSLTCTVATENLDAKNIAVLWFCRR